MSWDFLLDDERADHAHCPVSTDRTIVLEPAGFVGREFNGSALAGIDLRRADRVPIKRPVMEIAGAREVDFDFISQFHADFPGRKEKALAGDVEFFDRG